MGKFSREKGKRGEREFAALCNSEGFECFRTAQCKGKTGDAGDVEGLAGIHIEVKRAEKLALADWLAQSVRDSEAEGKGNLPIVAHRKSREGWLITMRAEDWFKMYREYEVH